MYDCRAGSSASGGSTLFAQGHTERILPDQRKHLAEGTRFIDRFLPMPANRELTDNTWGAEGVVPRDVTNGIGDTEWSITGGVAGR